jgi:hypothetical protein
MTMTIQNVRILPTHFSTHQNIFNRFSTFYQLTQILPSYHFNFNQFFYNLSFHIFNGGPFCFWQFILVAKQPQRPFRVPPVSFVDFVLFVCPTQMGPFEFFSIFLTKKFFNPFGQMAPNCTSLYQTKITTFTNEPKWSLFVNFNYIKSSDSSTLLHLHPHMYMYMYIYIHHIPFRSIINHFPGAHPFCILVFDYHLGICILYSPSYQTLCRDHDIIFGSAIH